MSINDKPTTDVELDAQSNENVDVALPDELTVLKDRARIMGIQFSNNIGLDALRKKVQEHMEEPVEQTQTINPFEQSAPKAKSKFQEIRDEQTRLVRVRIQNLDPKKANLPGEFITIANDYMGTIRRFVPYGAATDNGYHIEYCIYQFLLNRKYSSIFEKKDPKTGRVSQDFRMVKEMAIELLPSLTKEELNDLAITQAASGSFRED